MMRKLLILVTTLAVLTMPAAAVESKPSVGDRLADLWQTAQDKAPDVADKAGQFYESAKEKAPGTWDAAKDKAGEIYQSAKDKAPEVIDKAKDSLHDAQDAISSWNQDQQDQFWQWTEQMQSGSKTTTPPTDANTPPTDTTSSDEQTNSSPTNSPAETAPNDTPANIPPIPPQPDDGQAPPLNLDDPALETQKDPTNSDLYAHRPDQTNADESQPYEPRLEKGDGYVVVDGERYEKIADDEESEGFWDLIQQDLRTRTKLFPYMVAFGLAAIVLIWIVFWFKELRRKKRR